MKHLVSYNESETFLRMRNILYDLKDIVIELEDKGYTVRVYPDNEIQIKLLSLQDRILKDIDIPFYVEIEKLQGYRHTFKIKEVSDVIQRLIDYMNSNGFKSIVKIPTKHHVNQLAILNIQTNTVSDDDPHLQDFIDQKVVSIRISFNKKD